MRFRVFALAFACGLPVDELVSARVTRFAGIRTPWNLAEEEEILALTGAVVASFEYRVRLEGDRRADGFFAFALV